MKHQLLLTRPRATALVMALALTFGPGGLLPAGLAMAATKSAVRKEGPTVTLNFVNAEIEGVARAMAAIVERQILVDPRVKGNITLYSDQPLTPREAYLNFLAALRGQGFTVVEVSGLLKVVPEAEAKLQTGTVDVGAVKRSGDQVITQIFRVQYETANNLVTVLRPLISPNNTINANAATNTLVITDYADNLKRIAQMIAALDVPVATDMEAIPLQYAIASDLAPVVQKMADGSGSAAAPGGAAGGSPSTLVMADARTNTLLVRAPNAARMALVRTLIQRLDRPGTSGLGGSGIHVVYLKNADAVKLAQVLRAAFPSANGSTSGSASGASGTGASSPLNSGTGASTAAATSTQSGAASSQSASPVAASAQPSTGGFIQADPATNSLVITATDSMYRQLRAVIDQLDGRRAQIYIEAMIVKVDAEKAAQLGVQWAGAAGSSKIVGVGTNLGTTDISSLTSAIATAKSGSIPSVGGLTVALARRLSDGTYSLGALANFLQTEAGGNILSTPNLVTLDNEEAKIVVGENVPFVTGSYTNTGTTSSGTVNPFQTIERKDVGLTLRVRPQVGEGGTVRMTIFQEDARVSSTSTTSGPTTSKSSIESTVVVDDGQVLVLGGLMKDEYSDEASKVPLLGDIPVLGNLFKSQERSRKKTNLMVFLRPIVMRTQEAANALTMDRYDLMRQRQADSKPAEHPVLGINEVPMLDPLKLSNQLSMPSVRQPLDEPNGPTPTVVMPGDSRYAPKLMPTPSAPAGQ
ncbi:type II secretion system secretin GspD [Aquabacterium sp.]|uniref:type II secretion system secretin GspD n=1 Tax=Aquabacterium sp. TaxID=1872578 RepID=UPI0035B46BE6